MLKMRKTHIPVIEKKTSKFKRFPINTKLKAIIEDYIKDNTVKESFFTTRFGNILYRVQVWIILNIAGKEVGIDCNVGTHTLRKTFGYQRHQ